MSKGRCYIAGPMRGYRLYNFPAFDAAEALLKGLGWDVYNPARVDRELDGFDPATGMNLKSPEVYMRRDFAAILDPVTTAIAMLPGWRESSGAPKEHAVAVAVGLAVIDATTGEALVEAGDPTYLSLLADMETLHRAKAAGYSGVGALDTWQNFREAENWGISPLQGCLVRLGDKYKRAQHVFLDPANDQVGESLVVTLMDLASYGLIGICLIKEGSTQAPIDSGRL